MLKNTTGRRKRCAGRALSILLSIAILLAGCANPKIAPPVNSAADSTRIVDPPFASADSVRVQEGIPRVECYMHQEQAFCVSNENVMTHRDPAMAGYFADLAATQDVALHCGADTFYFPFNRIDSAEFAAAFLPGGGTDTGLPGHTTGDSGGGDAFFADLTIPAFQNDCPTANQLFYEDRNGEMQFHIPGGGGRSQGSEASSTRWQTSPPRQNQPSATWRNESPCPVRKCEGIIILRPVLHCLLPDVAILGCSHFGRYWDRTWYHSICRTQQAR
ncbi:MAG: hypothetical protein R2873_17725 [Caldilineaceae bacterium]